MSTFTPNMPLVNQDISVTQPLIEANFNSLFSWSGVDHTPLNGTTTYPTQGTHQAIRFEQQSGDPVTSSSQIGFYNKLDVNSINQLFMRLPGSSTVQQVTGPVSITGAIGPPPTWIGRTMLLGGITLFWGNALIGSATTVTFPFGGFATNCFGVLVTINNTSAPTQSIQTDSFPSKVNFTARINGPTLPLNCFWMAIGN